MVDSPFPSSKNGPGPNWHHASTSIFSQHLICQPHHNQQIYTSYNYTKLLCPSIFFFGVKHLLVRSSHIVRHYWQTSYLFHFVPHLHPDFLSLSLFVAEGFFRQRRVILSCLCRWLFEFYDIASAVKKKIWIFFSLLRGGGGIFKGSGSGYEIGTIVAGT